MQDGELRGQVERDVFRFDQEVKGAGKCGFDTIAFEHVGGEEEIFGSAGEGDFSRIERPSRQQCEFLFRSGEDEPVPTAGLPVESGEGENLSFTPDVEDFFHVHSEVPLHVVVLCDTLYHTF